MPNMSRGQNSYIRKKDREYLKQFDTCMYCKQKCDPPNIEHIEPLHLGGTSDIPNLTIACARCNSFKGVFTVHELGIRMIDKRTLLANKIYGYCQRLRRYKKRVQKQGVNSYVKEMGWLKDKIRSNLKEHSYYSQIINSITNKTYSIYYGETTEKGA